MTEQTKYICKHDRLWRSCNECYLEDEIRRLREVKEQLNTLITEQGNRLWDAAEEINRLKKVLNHVLVGATHESCDHEDVDPAWHCCDWSETVKRIESVLKEEER